MAAVPVEVEVALGEQGLPVDGRAMTLQAGSGAVQRLGEIVPGRYRYRYLRAAPGEDRLEARVDGEVVGRWSVEVLGRVPTGAAPPPVGEAAAGASRIEVRFPTPVPLDADALRAFPSEGRVVSLTADATGVTVVVEPTARTPARMLAVGLLDLSRPGLDPVVALVRLRDRRTADLSVGAGSSATVKVGRRTYGPFPAGPDGTAVAVFDVLPGETTAEITASDDLGNVRRIPTPLPSDPSPVLLALDAPTPDGGGRVVHLAGYTPAGAPWTGEPVSCRAAGGDLAGPVAVGPGRWQALLAADPTSSAFDLRLDCGLGAAAAVVRAPVGGGRPARLDLQVFPDALSADFPLAEVRAGLLDARGERLDPAAVTLAADLGALTTRVEGGYLRAEYRGEAAVAAGGDAIEARWAAPAGEGAPWSVDLHAAWTEAGLRVLGRVLDGAGRPLPGAGVTVGAGAERAEATADGRGWVDITLDLPRAPLAVVRVTAGSVAREAAVFAGLADRLPDPAAADLSARVPIVVRAGTVRRMYLDVSPRPLDTGAADVAAVTVRLLDAAGNVVRGEPVTVVADAGTVAAPSPRADGTWVATYTPPPGAVARTVQITASASGASVSTDLELVPGRVRGSVALGAGWTTNLGAVSAPALGVVVTRALPEPVDALAARVGLTAWPLAVEAVDPLTGEPVRVEGAVMPLEVGLEAAFRRRAVTLGGGVSLLAVPYALSAELGGERAVSGPGLGPPGLLVHGAAGWRMRLGEPFVELRYTLASLGSGSVEFEGSVGGLSALAGYRVFF